MVDARVACIAKNYTVDEQTKLAINQLDKQSTKSFDAPNDPLDPVFITKNGQKESTAASKRSAFDNSDDDSNDEEVMRRSSLTLRRASSKAAPKQQGDKRVSMHSSDLKRALIEMFQRRSEYRLNEMVEYLDHPVQPLKAMLKELADFDKSAKVYKLKSHFCLR